MTLDQCLLHISTSCFTAAFGIAVYLYVTEYRAHLAEKQAHADELRAHLAEQHAHSKTRDQRNAAWQKIGTLSQQVKALKRKLAKH